VVRITYQVRPSTHRSVLRSDFLAAVLTLFCYIIFPSAVDYKLQNRNKLERPRPAFRLQGLHCDNLRIVPNKRCRICCQLLFFQSIVDDSFGIRDRMAKRFSPCSSYSSYVMPEEFGLLGGILRFFRYGLLIHVQQHLQLGFISLTKHCCHPFKWK